MIELCCAETTALLPNLRPGDAFEIGLVDGRVRITADATPLMLDNIIAAWNSGAVCERVSRPGMESHLRALRDVSDFVDHPSLRAG